nr:hypothetical protein GCM10020092_063570 [Actinoplanes digitatis]
MNDPTTPDDGPLLARLGALLNEAEEPPADAMELARQSFTLRRLDAELAALVEDSHGPAASVRSVAVRGSAREPRQLTFQIVDEHGRDELIIAVQVESVGQRRRSPGTSRRRAPPTSRSGSRRSRKHAASTLTVAACSSSTTCFRDR